MTRTTDLLSAPNEGLKEHLERVMAQWDAIKHRFEATLPRMFGSPWREIDQAVRRMLLLHDLGKATQRWQPDDPDSWKDDDIGSRKQRPPHAQIGAAYLWWAFGGKDDDLTMASAFAVAIHHTDSALARPGVEDPATLLVQNGLVNEADDRISWHKGLGGFLDWLGQEHGLALRDPTEMTVYDVASFALGLREWARGARLLKLHQRRLQVAALHSIIKVCDIRAAALRSEGSVPVNTFTRTIVNGGLLPWER